MSKLETRVTAAITAFTVIATASAALSLGFFVHANKKEYQDHTANEDLLVVNCILFAKDSQEDSQEDSSTIVNGITGACNFIISGEAIILALLLTAIGSIAVSIYIR